MSDTLTVPVPSSAKLSPIDNHARRLLEQGEDWLLNLPQCQIHTDHLFHAGMYARTIYIPPGVVLTGAWIKIPTIVIVNGDLDLLVGRELVASNGYKVFAGSANRKQVFITRSVVEVTMIFPTEACTVYDAECEFTDEADRLMSRMSDGDTVRVTGE